MTQKQNIGMNGIVPEITPDTEFWWDGINNHELHYQNCRKCEKNWFPPVDRCPYCGSESWVWEKASGLGNVYSWVVVHRAFDPTFVDDVPFTVLTVQLEEGPKVLGRLISDHKEAPVYGDMPVRAHYYKVGEQTFLGFSPV